MRRHSGAQVSVGVLGAVSDAACGQCHIAVAAALPERHAADAARVVQLRRGTGQRRGSGGTAPAWALPQLSGPGRASPWARALGGGPASGACRRPGRHPPARRWPQPPRGPAKTAPRARSTPARGRPHTRPEPPPHCPQMRPRTAQPPPTGAAFAWHTPPCTRILCDFFGFYEVFFKKPLQLCKKCGRITCTVMGNQGGGTNA